MGNNLRDRKEVNSLLTASEALMNRACTWSEAPLQFQSQINFGGEERESSFLRFR